MTNFNSKVYVEKVIKRTFKLNDRAGEGDKFLVEVLKGYFARGYVMFCWERGSQIANLEKSPDQLHTTGNKTHISLDTFVVLFQKLKIDWKVG